MTDDKKDKSLALDTSQRAESNDSVGQISDEFVLTKDGLKLFPQPVVGDDLDPLNWPSVQKYTILAIVMAL